MLTATESQVDHSFCSKQRGQVGVQAADSCSHCESEPSETAPEHSWGKEGPRTGREGIINIALVMTYPGRLTF